MAAAAAILLHPGAMLPPCESFVTRQPSSATVRSRRRDGASRLRMSTAPTPSPGEDGGPSPLDMDGLRERMRRQEDQYARLVAEQASYVEEEREVPESVHIVLFRPGTPEQHVHTIEIPMGSGNNVILAFEGGADCYSFARALQDLEFADPCVSSSMVMDDVYNASSECIVSLYNNRLIYVLFQLFVCSTAPAGRDCV